MLRNIPVLLEKVLHMPPIQRGLLLILTGPVGAGKSSTAAALTAHLRAQAIAAASIDLDLIYCMARQRDGFGDEAVWPLARRGAAALAGVFFRADVQVVVLEGACFSADERSELMDGLDSDVDLVAVTLQVSFEAALRRVQADPDPGRVASRIPATLRALHQQFLAAMPYLAQTSMLVEADQLPLQEVVERIAAVVMMDAASRPQAGAAMPRSES